MRRRLRTIGHAPHTPFLVLAVLLAGAAGLAAWFFDTSEARPNDRFNGADADAGSQSVQASFRSGATDPLAANQPTADTPAPDLQAMDPLADGKLVVLTRNSPATYFVGRDDEVTGFEYELVTEFAESVGVEAEFKIYKSLSALLNALEAGDGEMAAAQLTVTAGRSERFDFSEPYMTVHQRLVCRQGGVVPRSLADLDRAEIEVIARSSYQERLEQVVEEVGALSWEPVEEIGLAGLMRRVWNGVIDCTVADSNLFTLNRRYHPELVSPFALSDAEPVAWAVTPGAEGLVEKINRFLDERAGGGLLERLERRFFGFFPKFDFFELATFRKRIEKRLPQYKDYLEEAAEMSGLPWTVLAAVGYQESHWNPEAVSPTGVRGFMMLTRATAKEMNVADRTDVQESITGGARYLGRLLDRIPDDIAPEDRLWFALAAYNMGLGHVYDARALAERRGLNKSEWDDVETVLPLLQRKEHYSTLRYGYARGHEAKTYVRRIRDYLDILENTFS